MSAVVYVVSWYGTRGKHIVETESKATAELVVVMIEKHFLQHARIEEKEK